MLVTVTVKNTKTGYVAGSASITGSATGAMTSFRRMNHGVVGGL